MKIFQSNTSLRVVSVIIAVILWFVFLNEDNPYKEKIFTIPIKVLNENSLAEKGLYIKNEYVDTVEISVRGREKVLEKISVLDFKLATDFAQIETSGQKRIILGIPNYDVKGIKVSSMEPEILEVEIGMQGNRELEVEVIFEGEVADRYKILEVIQVPETIIIDGEENEISIVAKAKAFINIEGFKSSFSTKKEVVIYDINDEEIVKLRNKYRVDAKVTIGKEVSLISNIIGIPHKDFYVNNTEVNPRTIFIIGEADILETISSVQSTQIDITNLEIDKIFDISPILPAGIRAGDGYSFGTLKVSLGNIITKTVTINSEDVLLSSSNPDEFEYNILPKIINISVRGKDKDLEFFTGKDLKGRVNVANMEKSPSNPIPLLIDAPINVEIVGVPTVNLEIIGK